MSEIKEKSPEEFKSIANWLETNSAYQLPNLSRADFTLREVRITPVGIISCEVELSDKAKFSVTVDTLPIGRDFETEWKEPKVYTDKSEMSQGEKNTSREDRFTPKQHDVLSLTGILIRSIPVSMPYEEIATFAQKGFQHIIDKSIKDKQTYEEYLSALKDLIRNNTSYHGIEFEQSIPLDSLPDSTRDAIEKALERYRDAHKGENAAISSIRLLIHPGVKIGLLLRDQGGYMGAVVDLEQGSLVKLLWGGPAVGEKTIR